jgi:hypothetical protein
MLLRSLLLPQKPFVHAGPVGCLLQHVADVTNNISSAKGFRHVVQENTSVSQHAPEGEEMKLMKGRLDIVCQSTRRSEVAEEVARVSHLYRLACTVPPKTYLSVCCRCGGRIMLRQRASAEEMADTPKGRQKTHTLIAQSSTRGMSIKVNIESRRVPAGVLYINAS